MNGICASIVIRALLALIGLYMLDLSVAIEVGASDFLCADDSVGVTAIIVDGVTLPDCASSIGVLEDFETLNASDTCNGSISLLKLTFVLVDT